MYDVLGNEHRCFIRIDLQCEKLLGLAGGNTKNRGNKKSGKNSNPFQRNSYVHFCEIKLAVFLVFQGQSCHIGGGRVMFRGQ